MGGRPERFRAPAHHRRALTRVPADPHRRDDRAGGGIVMTAVPLSSRVKSWPVWMLMGLIVVVLLTIGATRDNGPLTQSERIDAISQRLACPTCNGESVYVSRAAAAESIRNQVARDVSAGKLTDDEIIAAIASTFEARVLLVPRATGFDALVWVLPIAVAVCSVTALGFAFRRWRKNQGAVPSEDDVALVERLLADDPTDEENV
ncbi:MAG: cytochrome c-type biogenesis protein CcmH [Actinobacteria bacterium]|nr:cytochrome c-type biogenesis protein CcmH [Actinomycetota bacterium]